MNKEFEEHGIPASGEQPHRRDNCVSEFLARGRFRLFGGRSS